MRTRGRGDAASSGVGAAAPTEAGGARGGRGTATVRSGGGTIETAATAIGDGAVGEADTNDTTNNEQAEDTDGIAVRKRLRPRDGSGRAGPERPAKRPCRVDPEPRKGEG